jgi:hypothetical protein
MPRQTLETEVAVEGLVVTMHATEPKIQGFKLGRGNWIFKGDQNP